MSTASPRLELDWEMGVFKALRALWRAVAPVTRRTRSGRTTQDRFAHSHK